MTSTASVCKICNTDSVCFYLTEGEREGERERERLLGRDVLCDSLCVQQREVPSVPGCASEIPLRKGISDLSLHSVMPYIGWFNYGPFHTLKYGV